MLPPLQYSHELDAQVRIRYAQVFSAQHCIEFGFLRLLEDLGSITPPHTFQPFSDRTYLTVSRSAIRSSRRCCTDRMVRSIDRIGLIRIRTCVLLGLEVQCRWRVLRGGKDLDVFKRSVGSCRTQPFQFVAVDEPTWILVGLSKMCVMVSRVWVCGEQGLFGISRRLGPPFPRSPPLTHNSSHPTPSSDVLSWPRPSDPAGG